MAKALGVKSVDKIFVHPEAEFYVSRRRIKGKTYKSLHIGFPYLNALDDNELQCILCHEYGHVYYSFIKGMEPIHDINNKILLYLENQYASRFGLLNIAYWILRFFYLVFSLYFYSYSRMDEYLADYVAITTYGSKCFSEALIASIKIQIRFFTSMKRKYEDSKNESTGSSIRSPYSKAFLRMELQGQEKEYYNLEMYQKKNLFDTHPTHAERIKYSNNIAMERSIKELVYTIEKESIEKEFIGHYDKILNDL